MNIRPIIESSYRAASRALVMGTSPSALARARERAFVKTLATQFEAAFAEIDAVRVFSEFGRGNLDDFGVETLFSDIAVCRIAAGSASGRDPADFLFIASLIWQVEIEFSRDWRCAVYALNRLNGGAAENKLLIGALPPTGGDDYRQTIRPPFAAGAGNTQLALIPHPAAWETSEEQPEIWRLVDGGWDLMP